MIHSCTDDIVCMRNGLSRRQQQILDFICDGFSSKQMANHLGLSIKTIEMHRTRLHQRLGTRNAQQVMRRVGWLKSPHEQATIPLEGLC